MGKMKDMDKRSFFAGLRVGLALGRTGRDADAVTVPSGQQSASPAAAEIEMAGADADGAEGGASPTPAAEDAAPEADG